MAQLALKYRLCRENMDRPALIRFVETQREALSLSDRSEIDPLIDRLFTHGGILAGFDVDRQIQSVCGFTMGDPEDRYADRSLGCISVTALSADYRLNPAFIDGLHYFVLSHLQMIGLQSVRLQVNLDDHALNTLYGRLARPVGESRSSNRHQKLTYSGSLKEALAFFHGGRTANRQTSIQLIR